MTHDPDPKRGHQERDQELDDEVTREYEEPVEGKDDRPQKVSEIRRKEERGRRSSEA